MKVAPRPGRDGLQFQLAAHRAAQGTGGVEAQAGALAGGAAGAALEATEQALAVLVGDAGAVVSDGDQEVLGLGLEGNHGVDRRPTAVAHRVVQQRPQDLVELVGVAQGQPALGAVLQGERHVGGTQRLPRAANPWHGREHLQPRAQRPGLDAADGQELADHAREAVDLLGHDVQPPVGPFGCQLLGVAADAGQRGLQVVRDAAQEVVLGLVEARPAGGSGPRRGRTAGRCGSRRRPRSRTGRGGPGPPAPSDAWRAGGR